jgi:integrase
LLSVIIEYRKEQNYLPIYFNIDKKKLRKKKSISKIEIINKDGAKKVIEYFHTIQNFGEKIYLLLPFYCVLRASKIRGLNRKNINLEDHRITVNEKMADSDPKPAKILKSNSGYGQTIVEERLFYKIT